MEIIMKENQYQKSERLLKKWFDSDDAKIYFEKERKKQEFKLKRFARFEKWLENNDFEALMYRLILEHSEEWREKCYHKGYEPYPNNKLSFLIDFVCHNYDTISVSQLENMFHTEIWFFKGYYFRLMYGQGTVFDLYNGKDFKHLLSA
jgi:hypothetical protein